MVCKRKLVYDVSSFAGKTQKYGYYVLRLLVQQKSESNEITASLCSVVTVWVITFLGEEMWLEKCNNKHKI